MKDKCGLVLEGGAMRGMFTAGVLDVMMENCITFDGIIGVSAGAVFGCNYKSGQIGRTIRYNTKYCKDKRFCSLRSLFTTGDLFGRDFCYNRIPNELDKFDIDTYKNNPTEFYVTVTDLLTGKPIYKRCDNADAADLEWYRASASMPLVSRIVKIGEYKLLDGGITDPIPLKFFESIGYKRNIVILTQPEKYVKRKSKALPLIKAAYKKYPALTESMRNRHTIYNEQVEYIKSRETEGEALVIRPPFDLGISHIEHNPDKLKEIYEIGRKECTKKIEKIKRFLQVGA